ncbi:MAG: hypothetical protein UY81_C0061G0001, partial [Candidatus Giovannonibacteria bacterium GW2011_GWA2_53_7]
MNEKESSKNHLGPTIGLGALAGAIAGLLVGIGSFFWMLTWLDQPSTWEALRARQMEQDRGALEAEESATVEIVGKVAPAVTGVTIRKPMET